MGLRTIVAGAIDSVPVCDFQCSEDALTAILPSGIDSFHIWEMTGAVFVFELNCFDGIAFELILAFVGLFSPKSQTERGHNGNRNPYFGEDSFDDR